MKTEEGTLRRPAWGASERHNGPRHPRRAGGAGVEGQPVKSALRRSIRLSVSFEGNRGRKVLSRAARSASRARAFSSSCSAARVRLPLYRALCSAHKPGSLSAVTGLVLKDLAEEASRRRPECKSKSSVNAGEVVIFFGPALSATIGVNDGASSA